MYLRTIEYQGARKKIILTRILGQYIYQKK